MEALLERLVVALSFTERQGSHHILHCIAHRKHASVGGQQLVRLCDSGALLCVAYDVHRTAAVLRSDSFYFVERDLCRPWEMHHMRRCIVEIEEHAIGVQKAVGSAGSQVGAEGLCRHRYVGLTVAP